MPAEAGIHRSVMLAEAGIHRSVMLAEAGIHRSVMPAEAGIQCFGFTRFPPLLSREQTLCGNDEK
jgi:hypothetical protein